MIIVGITGATGKTAGRVTGRATGRLIGQPIGQVIGDQVRGQVGQLIGQVMPHLQEEEEEDQDLLKFCNGRPQAGNRGETWDYCAWGKTPQVAAGLAVIFNWTYSDPEGDPQTAYEIWVDDNPNFPDPKFNNLVTLSPSPGPDFSYALNLADDDNSDWISQLNWNTTYYWKVRVKDSQGNWSDWSSTDSFTTPLHAHPFINFNWIPEKPSVKELVYFTDQSEVFGGTTKSSWYWTFQDGNPSSSNLQNATTTFTSIGSKTVSLRVTDSDGYSCSGSKTVQTTLPLPEWREISPF